MPIELTDRQVTRQPNGDWQFGYTAPGPVSVVASQDLSDEVVRRIYEQVMGGLPLTGIGEKEVIQGWDRLAPVLAVEIERRVCGLGR